MVESAMLRFLATTFFGLLAFSGGLVVYWKTPGVLMILMTPLPMGISAAIAVSAAAIVACIPFGRMSVVGRRIGLPGALVSASVLSGVAGFVFGEALMGI
jgi:hypothetical protein